MSDHRVALKNLLQIQNAEAIAAAEANYEKLIQRIGNIVTENHIIFCTLGKMVANQLTAADKSCDLDDTHFPKFIDRTIKLHLNAVEAGLDECLKAFNINNSAIIQSILDISKK